MVESLLFEQFDVERPCGGCSEIQLEFLVQQVDTHHAKRAQPTTGFVRFICKPQKKLIFFWSEALSFALRDYRWN